MHVNERRRNSPAKPPPIGARIRRAMELKGWDQKRLAREMKVSRSAVNSWMNDRSYPRNAVARLELVLDVDLSSGAPARSFRPVSAELRRLIEQTLPDVEDQRRVIGLLEGTLTWPAEPGSTTEEPPAGSLPQAN